MQGTTPLPSHFTAKNCAGTVVYISSPYSRCTDPDDKVPMPAVLRCFLKELYGDV